MKDQMTEKADAAAAAAALDAQQAKADAHELEAARLQAEADAVEAARIAAEEAAAKAKADADAAKAVPKATKKLSEADLRAALTMIETRNTAMHREQLVADLVTVKGNKIEDKNGTTLVRLFGLECTNTAGLSMALTTWCSKARRAVMNGEAV